MDLNTVIEVDATVTLTQEEIDARDIDCVHAEEPEFNNTASKTWIPYRFAERMWANLKIKDLLKMSELAKDKRKKVKTEQIAICLALKYHLVTPVTSLLIVQEQRPSYDEAGERGLVGNRGPAGPMGTPGFVPPPVGMPGLGPGFAAQPGAPPPGPRPAPAPRPTAAAGLYTTTTRTTTTTTTTTTTLPPTTTRKVTTPSAQGGKTVTTSESELTNTTTATTAMPNTTTSSEETTQNEGIKTKPDEPCKDNCDRPTGTDGSTNENQGKDGNDANDVSRNAKGADNGGPKSSSVKTENAGIGVRSSLFTVLNAACILFLAFVFS